jgi:peptidoglycan hydrolase-like protein with peptidoglycan-binding domain
MKYLIRGSLAAAAIVTIGGAAMAQTVKTDNRLGVSTYVSANNTLGYQSNNEDSYVIPSNRRPVANISTNDRTYVTPRASTRNNVAVTMDGEPAYGSNYRDVHMVQTRLNELGYNVAVDGRYGPQTQAAIRDYQVRNNMTANGMINNDLLVVLNNGARNNNRTTIRTNVSPNNIAPAAGTANRPYFVKRGQQATHAEQYLTRSEIMAVQQRLRAEGYNIAADGVIGNQTRTVIGEFQREMGLTPTGRINAETVMALQTEANNNRKAAY